MRYKVSCFAKKDKIILKNNATQYTIKPYKKLTSDEIKAIVESR